MHTLHYDDTVSENNLVVVPADQRPWGALIVLAASVGLIVLDGTIVNVALPSMIDDLGLDSASTAWVGTVYALVFSALLITAGRLADLVGRRIVLIVGLIVFAAASLLAANAGDATAILTARAIQGVGGAFVLPCTLSTVNATYVGPQRARAFGIWGAVISGAAAIGPLLGGWLTTSFSWEWVFLVNAPLVVVLVTAVLILVPETKAGRAGAGWDFPGLVLSAFALALLVLGLVQGQDWGWTAPEGEVADWPFPPAPAAIGVGIALLVAFWFWEKRRIRAGLAVMLDVTLFSLPTFRLGNIAATVVAMGEFGLVFVLPLYLQGILGLDPMGSGWVLAAMAIGAFIAGAVAHRLAHRIGAARTATLGLALEAVSIGAFALLLSPSTPAPVIALFLGGYGMGLGLASAQLTSVVMSDVPKERSGQASAAQSTVRQVGTALGIALTSTVFASLLSRGITGALSAAPGVGADAAGGIEEGIIESLGASLVSMHDAAVPIGAAVLDAVTPVYTRSVNTSLWVTTGILVVGALATLALPSDRDRS